MYVSPEDLGRYMLKSENCFAILCTFISQNRLSLSMNVLMRKKLIECSKFSEWLYITHNIKTFIHDLFSSSLWNALRIAKFNLNNLMSEEKYSNIFKIDIKLPFYKVVNFLTQNWLIANCVSIRVRSTVTSIKNVSLRPPSPIATNVWMCHTTSDPSALNDGRHNWTAP